MRQGRASHTAELNAFFRALESVRPAGRRLFEDRLARAFIAWRYVPITRIARLPGMHALTERYIDTRWPAVRPTVVARTRLIDDMVTMAARDGIEPFVMLGAGYDTRAYRLPALRDVQIFEVDHPDTQAAKRAALTRALPALPALPARLMFVACDFHQRDLASVMADAGYREPARTLVLWKGVTNHLSEPTVDATMRWCARTAPGSRLVFTYVHRDVLSKPEIFFGAREMFAVLDRAGERYTFGFEPGAVPDFLAERGLALESDVGAADYRARYLGDRARGIRGHEFYRIAQARVL